MSGRPAQKVRARHRHLQPRHPARAHSPRSLHFMVSMVVAIFFILLAVRQARLPKILPPVYGICSGNGDDYGIITDHGEVQCAVVVRHKVVETGSLAQVRFKWGDKDTLGPSISSPSIVRKSGLKIFFLPAGASIRADAFDQHSHALGWRKRPEKRAENAPDKATAEPVLPRMPDPRRPSVAAQYAVKAVAVITGLLTILAVRLFQLLRAPLPVKKRRPGQKCSLGVFLGSGGHTAEMVTLLSTLDLERYTPRVYVYCTGDNMSVTSVVALESAAAPPVTSQKPPYTLLALPRARKVAQPLLSSALSTLRTLAVAFRELLLRQLQVNARKPWVDLLLVNGPGTAVVLVAVCWAAKIIGLPAPTIIYVESFARVKSLSLSGKLLRPFVDRFVVQWPQKGIHKGWLV